MRLTDTECTDLDETRRLILSVLLRPYGKSPSAEMLGTIANAGAYHSGLVSETQLEQWLDTPGVSILDDLRELLDQINERLVAGYVPQPAKPAVVVD